MPHETYMATGSSQQSPVDGNNKRVHKKKSTKGDAAKTTPKPKEEEKRHEPRPCPHLCSIVPLDVPPPDQTQHVLHPRKDVFVLKVSKVGPTGDRRCRMELELVTPKSPYGPPPYRLDTREAQCEPECTCCIPCCTVKAETRKKKKRRK